MTDQEQIVDEMIAEGRRIVDAAIEEYTLVVVPGVHVDAPNKGHYRCWNDEEQA